MRTRLAAAIIITGIVSVSLLPPAQAGYCTAAEILEGYYAGKSLEEIKSTCDVLDVNRCSVDEVFYMIGEGFSLSDIYYECG